MQIGVETRGTLGELEKMQMHAYTYFAAGLISETLKTNQLVRRLENSFLNTATLHHEHSRFVIVF